MVCVPMVTTVGLSVLKIDSIEFGVTIVAVFNWLPVAKSSATMFVVPRYRSFVVEKLFNRGSVGVQQTTNTVRVSTLQHSSRN